MKCCQINRVSPLRCRNVARHARLVGGAGIVHLCDKHDARHGDVIGRPLDDSVVVDGRTPEWLGANAAPGDAPCCVCGAVAPPEQWSEKPRRVFHGKNGHVAVCLSCVRCLGDDFSGCGCGG